MSSTQLTEVRPARWRNPATWPLRTRLVAILIVLLSLLGILVGGTTEIFLRKTLYDGVDGRLDQAINFGRPAGRGGNFQPDPDSGFYDKPFGGAEIGSIQLTHNANEDLIHGGLVQSPTTTTSPQLVFA